MLFACLYVPDFPVAAVARAQPELRGLAVAVVEGAPPQLRVAAASAPARAAGVAAGMSELEALGRLPSLVVRRRSPERETAAQAALAWLAQSVSPRIELLAAGTVLLDLAGLDRLLGPPARLARELGQRLAALGLEANLGVAANPEAALHAARGFAGVTVIPEGREAERLGSLPLDVLLPVNHDAVEDDRATHGRATQILETLDRWGVRTFRALAALPEVAVAERLGQEGLRLQKLARGAGSCVLCPAEEEPHFEETLELESPVENLEPLAFVLSRLLDQICSRLRAHALAAQELRVRLELDSPRRHGDVETIGSSGDRAIGPSNSSVSPYLLDETDSKLETGHSKLYERTLRLPVPLAEARVFLKLLHLDLAAHPPPAPVVRVTLTAEPAKPRVEQGGLFLPQAPQPEKLELVLARLGAAGAENAGSPQLLDTHRPGAFRMTRFTPDNSLRRHGGTERRIGPSGDRVIGSLKDKQPPDGSMNRPDDPISSVSPCLRGENQARAPLLALRLFRPPLAARVQLRDGMPQHVSCAAIRGAVVWRAGPWRSSGDWWQVKSAEDASSAASHSSAGAASWAREEWDVALKREEAGLALYRIFRDLMGGKWLVEGEYD